MLVICSEQDERAEDLTMFTVHESIEKRPGHGEGGDED
jgi:hypothetical protein